MPIRIEYQKYSVEHVRAYPNWIFVYGDNMLHRGKAGQAIIRDEPNTFGIPTKWAPSMEPKAFFTDAERYLVWPRLDDLYAKLQNCKIIAWPYKGIGTGLAELPNRAPEIHEFIENWLCDACLTFGKV